MATSTETISVQCPCGKKLKAPATAVGRKAKCPACGNVLTIEAPPPPPVDEDDPMNALYDLADAEEKAAQSNELDDSPRCPKCGGSVPAGAAICVACGYDFRTKKKVATSKASASPIQALGNEPKTPLNYKGKEKAEREPGEGNYFLGLLFGVLFATGGAMVYGLAKYFLDEIPLIGIFTGWMVLLVGWLAGTGVDKGYKGGNVFAGITAAGITLVVVVITRVLVLAAFLAPAVKDPMDEGASDRDDENVVHMVMDEEMGKKNLSRHTATDEQEEAYDAMAQKRIEKMTDKEYAAYEKKSEAYESRERLYHNVRRDMLKEKKLDPFNVPHDQDVAASTEADKRVAAMSDSAVESKLKADDAKANEEFKAKFAEARKNAKANGSSSSGGSGINGSIIGFGIILGLLVLLWLFLPVVVAMLLAYKVAANA